MSPRRTAYAALLGMSLCFGGTWAAGKLAVAEVPPGTIAVTRFALATVLLWAWARSRAPLPRPTRRDVPLILAMGATAVAGYNLLFLYGLELAPATDGAIIVPGFVPVATAVLAWLLLGQRVGRSAAAGIAVALAGLVLVVDPAGSLEWERALGALLFLGGAVCWGIYSLFGQTATARFGSVSATLYGTAVGTVMLVPFSFAGDGWARLAAASGEALVSVAYLSLFGTVLAFVLFYEGVRRIGPSGASSFALLVPVFGVLGAVLLVGERLTALKALGGAVVIAGLWLTQRRPAAPV